jgi:hypothetical protein
MAALYQAAKVREGKRMGFMMQTGSSPRHGSPIPGSKGERREGNENPCCKQTAPHVMASLYQAAKVREGKGKENPCCKQTAPHVMASIYHVATMTLLQRGIKGESLGSDLL